MSELIEQLEVLVVQVGRYILDRNKREQTIHEIHLEQWTMQKESLAELDRLKKEIKSSQGIPQMTDIFGVGKANG